LVFRSQLAINSLKNGGFYWIKQGVI